ncbi:glutamate receptor ionotropic, delta-2-like [Panulirus ornatus]|uniref:glutamate receptor ionotropic, delta-2-like n=1 Tax=Panulirus ornatus TaxID=150431 RepID=UPI003A8B63AE
MYDVSKAVDAFLDSLKAFDNVPHQRLLTKGKSHAIYSGTLTATFAIVSYEKPINSLYDLAEAHRKGYTLGSVRDNNFVDALKSAESGIYYEVWPLFNHKDPDKSFVADPNEGIKRVMTHMYVFFNAELNSKLQAAQRGQDRFYLARQTFLPQGYGIACSSGSPYKDVFDSILIRMKEAGLLGKWANDEVIKVSKNIAPSVDSGPSPITIQHLQADIARIITQDRNSIRQGNNGNRECVRVDLLKRDLMIH